MFRCLRLNKMGAKRIASSFPLALLTCFLCNPTEALDDMELGKRIGVDELVDRGAVLKRKLSSNELSSQLFRLIIDLRKLKDCPVQGVSISIEGNDAKDTLFSGDLAPSSGTFKIAVDKKYLSRISLNIDCSDPGWLGPFLWVDFSSIKKDSILIEMQNVRETEVEYLGGPKSILIENIGEPMIIDFDTFDKMRREQSR